MLRAMESIMCSGEKRKTARSIFRSLKIWFLLQMKTICPYNVAAAWGHVQNHAHKHQQLAKLRTGWTYQVGKINRVILIQKTETGRERGRKKEIQAISLPWCMKWQEVIYFDDPKENTTCPHIVDLIGVCPMCWSMRLSKGF